MKTVLSYMIIIFFAFHVSVSGQKISEDSLLKKARTEIYNNPDNAINIAHKLLKKEKDVNKSVSLYLLISTANIAKRDFEQSLKNILKAKELTTKINNPRTQTTVLISVAIQYQQMDLFSKSLETLDEADEYIAKLPEDVFEKNFELARSYAIRGMIYKSQSNSEIALEKFLQSIKSFEKVNPKKSTYNNQSVVFYNIGYCYLNLNSIDKAEEAFVQSIKYARYSKANSLEAFALKGMAEVYKQKRRNQDALNILLKAENLCKKTNDLVLNEGIFKEMADNYLAIGNQNSYQIYHKKHLEMRFQREQNELSSINQVIDNHNKETLLKSAELKKNFRYYLIAAAGFGTIIIMLFLSAIFKIRKQNKRYQGKIQDLIRS